MPTYVLAMVFFPSGQFSHGLRMDVMAPREKYDKRAFISQAVHQMLGNFSPDFSVVTSQSSDNSIPPFLFRYTAQGLR